MIKEELIDKIKKLLALADSSNPNEAAVALSRAQKLMERYNIEAVDLKIENDISESVVFNILFTNVKFHPLDVSAVNQFNDNAENRIHTVDI